MLKAPTYINTADPTVVSSFKYNPKSAQGTTISYELRNKYTLIRHPVTCKTHHLYISTWVSVIVFAQKHEVFTCLKNPNALVLAYTKQSRQTTFGYCVGKQFLSILNDAWSSN
jgi:hypothetical protein